jgi:hypothetical protein
VTPREIALAAVDEALGQAIQNRFIMLTVDPKPMDINGMRAGLSHLADSHRLAREAVEQIFKET